MKYCIEPVITVINGKSSIPSQPLPILISRDVPEMAEFGSTFVQSIYRD